MNDLAPGTGAPVDPAGPLPFTLRSGAGNVLILALAPAVPFDTARAAIRGLLAEVPARFKGAQLRLDLGARELELFDLRRLLTLFKEFGVEVVGLHCTPASLHRYVERELKLKVYVAAPEVEKAAEVAPAGEESPTALVCAPAAEAEAEEPDGAPRQLVLDGTVRSGAVVRFAGDILVYGDVNPGAELVAGGNIVVLGALKGLACAGARGDDGATIFALSMRPTQLRIGKVIQMAPPAEERAPVPEVAWLAGGSIVVEPYRGRHPTRKEQAHE